MVKYYIADAGRNCNGLSAKHPGDNLVCRHFNNSIALGMAMYIIYTTYRVPITPHNIQTCSFKSQ